MSIARLNVALAASLLSTTALFAAPVEIEFDEVTNLAATVSPDGSEAILDIQGTLWRVPMTGGEATLVTQPDLEPARAHWSPSGNLVAMQAYKGGTFDIWSMAPDGSDLKQVTDNAPWDEREPEVSPDGTSIALSPTGVEPNRAASRNSPGWTSDRASRLLLSALMVSRAPTGRAFAATTVSTSIS